MLVFIDESGHPHPNDDATRPVLMSVCVREQDTNHLTRAIYSMKRNLLSGFTRLDKSEEELKAVKFLSKRALMKTALKREFVDSMFEYLRDAPITVFGVVMERPDKVLTHTPGRLDVQHIRLLQRLDGFMERDYPDHMATLIFDAQDPTNNRQLSDSCSAFMAVTDAGKAMKHVVANPLFVDSSLTPGIQVADWCAYVTRIAYEKDLRQSYPADPYLSAIKRYARIVQQKTIDHVKDDGFTWYGIATMGADRFDYDD